MLMQLRTQAAAALVLLVLCLGQVRAEDSLAYIGLAGGLGQVLASANYQGAGEFKENVAAFKIMAGIRPISWVGAEIDYLDFGNPSGSIYGNPARASLQGVAAFALLYLPIPVIDLYAKLGAARLRSNLSGSYDSVCTIAPCPPIPFQLDRTTTGFAAGVGAQYSFGDWAVRAEFERFEAGGETPGLLTVGFLYRFL